MRLIKWMFSSKEEIEKLRLENLKNKVREEMKEYNKEYQSHLNNKMGFWLFKCLG